MTVQRYHLRVYFLGLEKGRGEEHLDVADTGRLRQLLVAWADRHNPGTGNVRDYAEWRLDVHRLEPARADLKGPWVARVSLAPDGSTRVERR